MDATAHTVKYAPPGKSTDREVTCERFLATQALKRLAGVWKTPILLMLCDGPRRFAELQRGLAPISAKVLTERLRELEFGDLIFRLELESEPPKVVEYRLAPLGTALRPALDALIAWEQIMRSAGGLSPTDQAAITRNRRRRVSGPPAVEEPTPP